MVLITEPNLCDSSPAEINREDGVAEQDGVQGWLAGGALAGDWVLDPGRSEVVLHTRHTWGLRPLRGVFGQVTGQGTVSESGEVAGVITVAATSLDTKNSQRDKHLRSPDFFDVDNHPDFTFAVESASPAGAGARITGQLTVRGNTRPVSFEAKVARPGGDEVALDGELRINRADFGLTWNMLRIAAMDNTIAVHAVFTRR
jgi:polyisoprenoid-binding protein YceI